MLIAPIIRAAAGQGYAIPATDDTIQITQPLPDYQEETDLRLAEGQSAVYVRVVGRHHIKKVGQYTLDTFRVKNSAATWVVTSDDERTFEGSSQALVLQPRLSMKLVTPIVLLPSRHGLRTLFRFRMDADFRILSASKFRELINDKG